MCCGMPVLNGIATNSENILEIMDKYALVNKHFLPTQSLGLKVKYKPKQTGHSLHIDLPEAGPNV